MSSILFWNCRGARKREASLYLKEVVRDHKVVFIGIMETKLYNIDRYDVDCLIGSEWDIFHQPAVGLSGGILTLWNRNKVSFIIQNSSSEVVIGVLSTPSLGDWKVATVYGSRCCVERRDLWCILEKNMISPNPSLIGGDFNCVLKKEEKKDGKRFIFSRGPRELKSFMTNADFYDAGFIGPSYTWCNNKEGSSRIWERLDRCLVNSAFLHWVPAGRARHLARVASNHCPIVYSMEAWHSNKEKHFRFEDTWRSYPAARGIVYKSWLKTDFGDEVEILHRKIKRTLKALFFWNRNKCIDLCKLKDELKKDI
ncbi:hypothetical protein KFK09_026471 [Dendrobium nobile]|uniref:Endonuclease/exonuclease/phosphatase domain-containing protein n=1 Tax=Dendrobium nobile TaxID=94219 RepID=A0A8T3A884_DENNO|nr:hypothetical protein KFK09_026471 [Dendrobium nobile]